MFPKNQRRSIVDSLRSAFGFRLRRRRVASPYKTDVDHDEDDSEDYEDFVWDVPNPFAPLDPTQAHLHTLIQAEIARMRRHESIGPLQSLHGWNEFDDDEDSDDEDRPHAFESHDEHGDSEDAVDADDEDDDSEDNDDSDDGDANRPNAIVLHTLPRYTPSPLPPPPPPSPSTDDGDPLWHDLVQVYSELAEAEERARKARRDAHRSRLKALTVQGRDPYDGLI